MLHFVNQTDTKFVLKLTEDEFLVLCKEGEDAALNVVQVDVGSQGEYDELMVAVREKLAESNGEFEVRANRASKLYMSIPDISVLYSDKYAENTLIHMFAKETGLKASEYYYPKSAIFVITQNTAPKVDVVYADKEMNDLALGDKYADAPMFRAVTKEDAALPGFRITVFLCNVSKWDKIPEDTFIEISENLKLRVSTIAKTNTAGAKYSINALIRCDANGNAVQSHRKDDAGRHPGEGRAPRNNNGNGGNRNQNGNNNHGKGKGKKRRGRTRLSEITKDLTPINNDVE